ncbi:hypothetical protein [Chitinimonas lacunae]|uniref:Tetratricopeptide repeat protein n=1 Tax=Chitinimonas lacunae TaxID=1963018 RepID=A0ABV8MU84_9NEIS
MTAPDVNDVLTTEELLHLAIEASNRERYDLSISYLKAAIGRAEQPDARLAFMLGSQYAQIKMFDDARQWLEQSVAIDPDFEIAVFQLGLMYLLGNDMANNERVWAHLDRLPPEHALRCFREGLLAIARDQFDAGVAAIEQGLAVGYANPPLLEEMRKVIANVATLRAAAPTPAVEAAAPAAEEATGEHVLLSAYRE